MNLATKTLIQRTEDRGQKADVCHPSSVIRLRGFTLIEIVVAIGLLVMVIFFAGTIFKASIGSYRTAMAQAEIMRKLRVITQQLDNDFQGLRKDAPMFIWFEKGTSGDPNRFDQIMFFADGDFQATKDPIVGNVARIYYGQAQNSLRMLTRKQHILTANLGIIDRWPDAGNFAGTFGQNDPVVTTLLKNDTYEYDWLSLSQWQAIANQSASVDHVSNVCFGNRTVINLADIKTLHNLMAEGVGQWSIQWSYFYTDISTGQTHVYWWPSVDPDGSGNFTNSDFGFSGMTLDKFGFYFYSAVPTVAGWFSPDDAKGVYYPGSPANPLAKPVYPRALKFTFTLYDYRGVFKDGQTFTHIVYLGE